MKTYYTTYGPVRGHCGHKHRTARAANGCCNRDHYDCANAGGYSDRRIVAFEDGMERPLTDDEYAGTEARP